MKKIMIMTKAALLAITLHGEISWGDTSNYIAEVESSYGFSQTSNYENLHAAMVNAYSNYQANIDVTNAEYALLLIQNYLPTNEVVQLCYDFGLQQADYYVKRKAARKISLLIEAGEIVGSTLMEQINNKLWVDLANITVTNQDTKRFAEESVEILMMSHDDRGLDAYLTLTSTVSKLQGMHYWSTNSDTGVFQRLSADYDAETGRKYKDRELASFYNLLLRRASLNQPLVSTGSVVNLEKLYNEK